MPLLLCLYSGFHDCSIALNESCCIIPSVSALPGTPPLPCLPLCLFPCGCSTLAAADLTTARNALLVRRTDQSCRGGRACHRCAPFAWGAAERRQRGNANGLGHTRPPSDPVQPLRPLPSSRWGHGRRLRHPRPPAPVPLGPLDRRAGAASTQPSPAGARQRGERQGRPCKPLQRELSPSFARPAPRRAPRSPSWMSGSSASSASWRRSCRRSGRCGCGGRRRCRSCSRRLLGARCCWLLGCLQSVQAMPSSANSCCRHLCRGWMCRAS